MKVTRFLEREKVIRFFGIALLLAPFINLTLHILILKFQSRIAWQFFDFAGVLKTTNPVSYLLGACSVAIGFKMLSGSAKSWKFVLILIGSHLLVQILNINNKAWQGPLAWPSFLLNAGLFFFIVDQLVWKVTPDNPRQQVPEPAPAAPTSTPAKKVVNLKSYRKILFSFGATQPWGELKTLSSEELQVKSFAPVPANIESQTVQINFSKDVVIEIEFARREGANYYFRPLNMNKQNVVKLNQWLQKIAV
jgi:hypothetical protein